MSRAVAAALVGVLLLAGCGSAKDARRRAVNSYFTKIDQIERGAFLSWNRARAAYVHLGHGSITDQQLQDLSQAPGVIRSLRAQIAAVEAPTAARRLRASLLRLLDLDASFAREVDVFAHYVRGVSPLEKRIGSHTAELRRALHRSSAGASEQHALTRYAAQLETVREQLRRLRPPPALAPWHVQQARRIATLQGGARLLAAGIAKHDRALEQRGLTALTGAAATSPVTAADRAAIVAYNARLKRIGDASTAVAAEERRLTRGLG